MYPIFISRVVFCCICCSASVLNAQQLAPAPINPTVTGHDANVTLRGSGTVAAPAAKKPKTQAKPAPSDFTTTITRSESAAPDSVHAIQFDPREVPEVHLNVKYTTVIVIPKTENIIDYIVGDELNWVVNGADNFAYVRPLKPGLKTNINLVTASGNVYSFLLVEGDRAPDLKVLVDTKDADMVAAFAARPKWVQASEVETFKREAQLAKDEAAATRESAATSKAEVEARATEQINRFRSDFPGVLKFSYDFNDKKSKFRVHAIAHDDKRTYLWATSQETPALYEVKDGKPNLISFDYQNGVYVIDKILSDGYLAVGKHKMAFKKDE